jgi:hypothetical protein
MRHFLFVSLSFLLVLLSGCRLNKPRPYGVTAQDKAQILKDSLHFTQVTWLDSILNFGTVSQDEDVKMQYRFRNAGKYPLFLLKVTASCGCTVPEYEDKPIEPGGESLIKVTLKTKQQHEEVHKYINVEANTIGGRFHTLVLEGRVRDCCK